MTSISVINADSDLDPPEDRTAQAKLPEQPDISSSRSPSRPPSPYTPHSIRSLSPSKRHHLYRALSPDLPTRDALYIFSNFASYMRSPHEGAEGINSNADFRDTVRLLEFARSLAGQPSNNVHVLHLKYRFQGSTQHFRSPYATGDFRLPLNYRDSTGRLRNPVPQPFSALNDPIVKIDYRENGVFEPLPAQAIFSHIAKACQPPPRIIVMSYVCSKVTDNHLASLSNWALTSSPPAYIFSPLETRLRESRPLHLALHHAIPMSMYASPSDTSTEKAFSPQIRSLDASENVEDALTASKNLVQRRASVPDIRDAQGLSSCLSEKQYPADPVASLIVMNAENGTPAALNHTVGSVSPTATFQAMPDRVPLWALAPGVGILHGSTSASVGVNLSDFSAINLVRSTEDEPKDGDKVLLGLTNSRPRYSYSFRSPPRCKPFVLTSASNQSPIESPDLKSGATNLDTSLRLSDLHAHNRLPVESPHRSITPSRALAVPLSRRKSTEPQIHLTPPTPTPHKIPTSQSQSQSQSLSDVRPLPQSWLSQVSRVEGWRKGRKEIMEDTLEMMESQAIIQNMRALAVDNHLDHPESLANGNTRGEVDEEAEWELGDKLFSEI